MLQVRGFHYTLEYREMSVLVQKKKRCRKVKDKITNSTIDGIERVNDFNDTRRMFREIK